MIDTTIAHRFLSAVGSLWLAAAAPYQVQLKAGQCAPAPPGLVAYLGEAWTVYGAYVQQCPVRGLDGGLALTVVTLRVDRAMADNFFAHRLYADLPKPLLRGPKGQTLGHLPENFPEEPPSALHVTFTDWVGGMPRRVMLYEAGESAIEPHALDPLVWDPARRAYH